MLHLWIFIASMIFSLSPVILLNRVGRFSSLVLSLHSTLFLPFPPCTLASGTRRPRSQCLQTTRVLRPRRTAARPCPLMRRAWPGLRAEGGAFAATPQGRPLLTRLGRQIISHCAAAHLPDDICFSLYVYIKSYWSNISAFFLLSDANINVAVEQPAV